MAGLPKRFAPAHVVWLESPVPSRAKAFQDLSLMA